MSFSAAKLALLAPAGLGGLSYVGALPKVSRDIADGATLDLALDVNTVDTGKPVLPGDYVFVATTMAYGSFEVIPNGSMVGGGGETIISPTGNFSKAQPSDSNYGNQVKIQYFVYNGSTDFRLTFTSTGAGIVIMSQAVVFRKVNQATPIGALSGDFGAGTANVDLPDATMTSANSLCLGVGSATHAFTPAPWDTPPAATYFVQSSATEGGGNPSILLGFAVYETGGSSTYNPAVWTGSYVSATAASYNGITFSVNP